MVIFGWVLPTNEVRVKLLLSLKLLTFCDVFFEQNSILTMTLYKGRNMTFRMEMTLLVKDAY